MSGLSKTKHLPINMIHISLQPNASVEVTLNNDSIEKVRVIKLLGVKILNDLKWDSHAASIISKVSIRLRSFTILKRSGMEKNKRGMCLKN